MGAQGHILLVEALAEQVIIGSNWFPHSGTSASADVGFGEEPVNMLSLHLSEPPLLGRSSSVCQVSQMSGSPSSRCALETVPPLGDGPLKPPAIRNSSLNSVPSHAARYPFPVRHE